MPKIEKMMKEKKNSQQVEAPTTSYLIFIYGRSVSFVFIEKRVFTSFAGFFGTRKCERFTHDQ